MSARSGTGFIIDAFLLPVSKTIARVVSQCDRIPWTILETPQCSEEKKQRALQALSAKLAQLAALRNLHTQIEVGAPLDARRS